MKRLFSIQQHNNTTTAATTTTTQQQMGSLSIRLSLQFLTSRSRCSQSREEHIHNQKYNCNNHSYEELQESKKFNEWGPAGVRIFKTTRIALGRRKKGGGQLNDEKNSHFIFQLFKNTHIFQRYKQQQL